MSGRDDSPGGVVGRRMAWLRLHREIDMTGVTVLGRGENGTTKYRLQDGIYRREFTLTHNYAGSKMVGCSEISSFVTAREAAHWDFLTEGDMRWTATVRDDGWLTFSHHRTLRKVLKSARASIAQERSEDQVAAEADQVALVEQGAPDA